MQSPCDRMSPILVASILIRLVAMGWSVVLLRRVRDLRMGFLTAMLALMATRQILTLSQSLGPGSSWSFDIAGHLSELPGLFVSVLAALSVFFLERFIMQHRDDAQLIREREDELRQAQKMEAVGQLAGGVAHDFNNLLTVILANIELLRLHGDEKAARTERLAQLETAAMRAAALTRQLLTFARKQAPKREGHDANALLHELQPMMRRLLDERIELVLLLGEDLPLVEVDSTQIGQVLINLAVNAQHAITDQGTITISTLESDGSVVLRVRDDGVGMSDEVRGRIFEPFFTTKAHGEGTGLGLSICFGIVKEHGGHIEVRSEDGQGSEFDVVLPAADTSRVAPAEAESLAPRGTELVLVVEDEPAVRKVALEMLRSLGYRALESANGIDALQKLTTVSDVGLVLTDIMMPKMGGVELRARLADERPRLPVLMMSGYADTPVSDHVQVLSKPFSRQTLSLAVRGAIDIEV